MTSGAIHRRAVVAVVAALLLAGCKPRATVAKGPATPQPPPRPQISDINLKSFRPNEAGAIMVLMYHKIDGKAPGSDMYRSPEQFRSDVEALYKKGYRPITLSELAENRIDVPAGTTPVVFTFDDSYPSQFRFASPVSREIDGDCAVGIMADMHRRHPDWAMKATFFVLAHTEKYPPPFGDMASMADKFQYLVQNGSEVASHTATHRMLTSMSADQVKEELATAVRDIQREAPSVKVTSLALPYGRSPRDKSALAALAGGESGGTKYQHTAVAKAGWRPVMSPVTTIGAKSLSDQIAPFDPMGLERLVPDARRPNTVGTLEFYLKYFDENPTLRYVSDGNLQVVAVPKAMERLVDPARVASQGKTLQVYTMEAPPIAPPAPR